MVVMIEPYESHPEGGRSHKFVHALGAGLQLVSDWPTMRVVRRMLGGFGEIYVLEPTDGSFDGLIAAKTPRSDFGWDSNRSGIFQREALLWREMPPHPNILPCYGVWAIGERPYVLS